jgi:hypothetical protein
MLPLLLLVQLLLMPQQPQQHWQHLSPHCGQWAGWWPQSNLDLNHHPDQLCTVLLLLLHLYSPDTQGPHAEA